MGRKLETDSIADTPWIKTEDYAERVLWGEVENPLSKTKVTLQDGLEILELLETGVMVRLPARVASEGHVLRLRLEHRVVNPFKAGKAGKAGLNKKGSFLAFVAIGRVASIENAAPEGDGKVWQIATVNFTQFDEADWRKFVEDYEDIQAAVRGQVQARKG